MTANSLRFVGEFVGGSAGLS